MYIEKTGDLLSYQGDNTAPVWKLCPTNGSTDGKGLAVMGAGVARQLASDWPAVKYALGVKLAGAEISFGLEILGLHKGALWFAYPTKYRFTDGKADLRLIEQVAWQLELLLSRQVIKPEVVLPKLGCGCGKLQWRKVKPIFEKIGRRHEITVISKPSSS